MRSWGQAGGAVGVDCWGELVRARPGWRCVPGLGATPATPGEKGEVGAGRDRVKLGEARTFLAN